MSHSQRHVVTPLVLLATFATAGCHKQPEPAPTPVSTFNADSARLAQARADSIARARAEAQRRSGDAGVATSHAPPAADNQASLRNALTTVVHFDFDQATLSDDARAALDSKLPILLANPMVTLRIIGHTDERGSEEYNLALGQRRAATVKRYLTNQGVSENRIETVSFGEERPVAQGHDESAWAQNRRDEFEMTSAPQTLKRP
jgi:peptidoglycan-associated lipoprotein